MVMLYQRLSITGPVLFFLPVFIIQFLLRLYLQVTLANQELSVFYRVAKKLSRPLEADKIFDLILKEARRVVNYHSGIIYLKIGQASRPGFQPGQSLLEAEEKNHYRAVAGKGPQVKNLIGTTFTPKEGFLGWMVSQRRLPEIINDVRKDLRLKNEAGLPQVCRSLLIIPLQTENEILGIFMLGDKHPFAFKENHQDILTVVCHQAAVVLANIFLSQRVRVKANIDELTGIYSYHSFFHRATEECHRAGKEGSPLALIMLDVDAFQMVNDSFGRNIGDVVLAALARLIKEMVNQAGIVARYGGEEFVILLPNYGEVKAVHLAENIRRIVREHSFQAEGLSLNLKVSLGVAMYPQDANSLSELLQKADEALYRAKKRGKDCVVPFSGKI
jgi:diguanylate cyclase (GGDEF)-like protein